MISSKQLSLTPKGHNVFRLTHNLPAVLAILFESAMTLAKLCLKSAALLIAMLLMPTPVFAECKNKAAFSLADQSRAKKEILAAVDEYSKKDFTQLDSSGQEKVICFYLVGKGEQTNSENFLDGVVSFVGLLSNFDKAHRAFAEYNKTGETPTETPLGGKGFVRDINSAFPSASTFIDTETVRKIDTLVIDMYKTIIAKSKEESAKFKKENELLEALLKAL